MHDTELTTGTYRLSNILHSPEDNAVRWTFEMLHETVFMKLSILVRNHSYPSDPKFLLPDYKDILLRCCAMNSPSFVGRSNLTPASSFTIRSYGM